METSKCPKCGMLPDQHFHAPGGIFCLQAQLTAATSRAEALATGIEFIHSGRIVLSQADNGEWGAVLGTRIVTGCETAAEAVLAALLPPAKEVEGGK
jgi:hypothetical protein